MKLMHPWFQRPVLFSENRIQVLVIENRGLFSRMVSELCAQSEGEKGGFVLPEEDALLECASCLDVILDFFHLSPDRKRLQARFQAKMKAAAQQEPAKKPSPASVKKTYMDELERILNELYQLNEQIEDEGVSARIDRIGTLTAGIFRAVIDNPEREQDVRKFMNYYLPTTLKLLKSYDMLEEQSYQGENILASRKKIEGVLDTLIAAFEKQLDRLFQNDALDIATDIDVLETMMAGDGLSSRGQMGMR